METTPQPIKPYGHHENDGFVQVTFTLPVAASPRAQLAATEYAAKLGLGQCRVVWMEKLGEKFTSFVVYGQAAAELDWNQVPEPKETELTPLARRIEDTDKDYRTQLGRRIILCVLLDPNAEAAVLFEALLSLKGLAGETGIEGYMAFQMQYERGIASSRALVEKLAAQKADALLLCASTRQRNEFSDLDRQLQAARGLPAWFSYHAWQRQETPAQVVRALVQQLLAKGIGQASTETTESADESEPKKGRLWGWWRR